MTERSLSQTGAQRTFDRSGAKQDAHWRYEDPAVEHLIGASRRRRVGSDGGSP